ncbi:MAG: alpha/beta hydrolase-fold protein, partial [Prolixibacteraceae bacterium]
MKLLLTTFLLLLFVGNSPLAHAQETKSWQAKISVAPELQKSFNKGGRLLIRFSGQNKKEPRQSSDFTVGYTPQSWDGKSTFTLVSSEKGILSSGAMPSVDKVYCQVGYKHNIDDAQENAPGNWYSNIDSLSQTSSGSFDLTLSKVIAPGIVKEHKFVKTIEIQSKFLSEFSGHPRFLKASILLPATFFDKPGKSFPICYRAPGLNGRLTAINNKLDDKEFSDWWFSGKAPQIVYVFLDSQGPYGDSYQVDSENNGPCGKALTEELIPAIEKMVHYNPASKKRYLTGMSTGGWVAMGLQVFYPDFFD